VKSKLLLNSVQQMDICLKGRKLLVMHHMFHVIATIMLHIDCLVVKV